jgi:hypothetical protein
MSMPVEARQLGRMQAVWAFLRQTVADERERLLK